MFVENPELRIDHDGRLLVIDFNIKTVCYDNGFNDFAASLICRYLGISSHGYAYALPHNDNYSTIATDIYCNESAHVPFDCMARGFNDTVDFCSSDAAVKCHRKYL